MNENNRPTVKELRFLIIQEIDKLSNLEKIELLKKIKELKKQVS